MTMSYRLHFINAIHGNGRVENSLGQRFVQLARLWRQMGFAGGSVVKNQPGNTGEVASIPGSGRSPEEGNGNPLQYSCLENPTDGGTWQAIVHGVATSRTGLFYFTYEI